MEAASAKSGAVSGDRGIETLHCSGRETQAVGWECEQQEYCNREESIAVPIAGGGGSLTLFSPSGGTDDMMVSVWSDEDAGRMFPSLEIMRDLMMEICYTLHSNIMKYLH